MRSTAAPEVQTPRELAAAGRDRLPGISVVCIDNEPKVLDGMDALLGGWGCHVLKAPDLKTAIEAIADAQAAPDGLLVDYHLDQRHGIDVIAELRRRFGADLPAILITADRRPVMRDQARAHDIQVLSNSRARRATRPSTRAANRSSRR